MSFISMFAVAFIPLFVAIDPLGMMPVFVGLTEGLDNDHRRKLVRQATLTAFVISMVFLFAGRAIFKLLGITENDFRIGGGIVLLVLAVTDLLFSSDAKERTPDGKPGVDPMFGVVPLGIPVIMGPAALTAVLMSVDSYGILMSTVALIVNLLVVWIVFREAHRITAVVGNGGAKAFAKVSSLFMAAIAVMMIRVGITNFLVH